MPDHAARWGELAPSELRTALAERLTALRTDIRADPLANPVRQLAHELSRDLESGALDIERLGELARTLDEDAFALRAEHVARYLEPAGTDGLDAVVAELSAELETFEAFSAFWSARLETIVFTGHPTFLLTPPGRERLAEAALEGRAPSAGPDMPDPDITLADEHAQARAALHAATDAVHALNRALLTHARTRFAGEWRAFRPAAIGLATWVGYDMDGRNDITWNQVIAHRLAEKAERLTLYAARLAALGHDAADDLTARLSAAARRAERDAEAFAGELSTPDALASAANGLTRDDGEKLVTLGPAMDELSAMADEAGGDVALDLLALRAEMAAFGLGLGEVHFRLNAAQIRNAGRAALASDRQTDLFGRGALDDVAELIDGTRPVRVNFASLAAESSSAARILIAAAQIVKHVDADAPIRLLIAECENPVTVLTAIYHREALRRRGSHRRLPAVRDGRGARPGGTHPRRPVPPGALPAAGRTPGARVDRGGFLRCGALHGPGARRPRHRAAARSARAGDGAPRPRPPRGGDLRHPRREHGPGRAPRRRSSIAACTPAARGRGSSSRAAASTSPTSRASRAETATSGSPASGWPAARSSAS